MTRLLAFTALAFVLLELAAFVRQEVAPLPAAVGPAVSSTQISAREALK